MLLQSPNFRGRGRSPGNVFKFSSEAEDEIFWAHPEVILAISNSCEKVRAQCKTIESSSLLIAEESSFCSLSRAGPTCTQRLLVKAWRRVYRFRRKLISRLWLQNNKLHNRSQNTKKYWSFSFLHFEPNQLHSPFPRSQKTSKKQRFWWVLFFSIFSAPYVKFTKKSPKKRRN